jgi:hypothetical protein
VAVRNVTEFWYYRNSHNHSLSTSMYSVKLTTARAFLFIIFFYLLGYDFNRCFSRWYTAGYSHTCVQLFFFRGCVFLGLQLCSPGVFMGSGLILVNLAACGIWLWRTWRCPLCLCGISLSGGGWGFEVLLVALLRTGCSLIWGGTFGAVTEWCRHLSHFVEVRAEATMVC